VHIVYTNFTVPYGRLVSTPDNDSFHQGTHWPPSEFLRNSLDIPGPFGVPLFASPTALPMS
jgi:hypothetical protein